MMAFTMELACNSLYISSILIKMNFHRIPKKKVIPDSVMVIRGG